MMSRALVVLWWAVVCAWQDSLLCYSCSRVNSSEACRPALCLGPPALCFSWEVSIDLGTKSFMEITRGCIRKCSFRTPPEWDRFSAKQIITANTLCCSKSLCNRNN